jgi:hypothetical protein
LGTESRFVLTYFIDATPAQSKTLLALVLMAVFTQLPFFRDASLGSFSFKPTCFKEGFAPFCRSPFPHGLRVTNFSAFASVGVGFSKCCVPVHVTPYRQRFDTTVANIRS